MAANTAWRSKWEERLARPMFALALVYLMLMAAAIYHLHDHEADPWQSPAGQALLAGLLLLWPVFIAEGIFRYFLASPARRNWKLLACSLVVGAVPPLRLGAHGRTRSDEMWLPWLGWHPRNFDLRKTLEQVFSGPMLFMALMVLPVLAVEYFWAEAIKSYMVLRIVLGISVGIIWIAFTVEFVIRYSAADKKFTYAFNHWVDLAVILLPMLEFLPFLRMLRVTRALGFARLAKYYRLYGLAGRGWRGFVVLEVIQRLLSRDANARVVRLKGRLAETEERMRELELEADYYRRRLEVAEKKCAEPEARCEEEADQDSSAEEGGHVSHRS